MPGHIGTPIIANSRRIFHGTDSDTMSPEEIARVRARLAAGGMDLSQVSDADVGKLWLEARAEIRGGSSDDGRRRGDRHSRWG